MQYIVDNFLYFFYIDMIFNNIGINIFFNYLSFFFSWTLFLLMLLSEWHINPDLLNFKSGFIMNSD